MADQKIIYLNGEFVDWEKATVHMMSHSFSRGSAIFEVLGSHLTDDGKGAVFRLDEHIRRLFRSAELLDMEIPIAADELHTAVIETVNRNHLHQSFIKIFGYYPQIAFDTAYPQKQLDIAVFVLDPTEKVHTPLYNAEKGETVCISKWRKLDPQTVPIEAKVAANYINGIISDMDAKKRGYEHAIMLDTQGFVAEGGACAYFFAKEGTLLTAALGTVLQSITRKSVLQAAQITGIKAVEKRLPRDVIFEADEMFISGTPSKVVPINRLEDTEFKDVPGPMTQKIDQLIKDILAGRDDRFKDWLFPLE